MSCEWACYNEITSDQAPPENEKARVLNSALDLVGLEDSVP